MRNLLNKTLLLAALATISAPATAMDLSNTFSDYAEIATSGYTGDEVRNFPILVKISETLIPGFSYARAGATGEKIAFTSDGLILPHEIVKWDPSGESLIWVRMPRLTSEKKLTFWWFPWDGADLPEADSKVVWNDYLGVWHMDEEIPSGEEAATAVSSDATGRGLDILPGKGSVGDVRRMRSVAGVVGNARVIDSDATAATIKQLGNRLVVPGKSLSLGNTFTFSTWIKIDGYGNGRWPQLACMKATNGSGNGWSIEHSANDRRVLCVRGNGGSSFNATAFPQQPNAIAGFTHLAFAYDRDAVTVYANGQEVARGTVDPVQDNELDLWIGGGYPNLAESSVWGKYDETRLMRSAMTAAQAKAEYETIAKADFLAYSPAVKANPWDRYPSITPAAWELKDAAALASDITVDRGQPNVAEEVTVSYTYDDDPATVLSAITELTRTGTVTALFTTPSGIRHITQVTIYNPNPNVYDDLGGTRSGRVLLGNNDNLPEHEIWGQMISETDPTLETYWEHTLPVPAPLDHRLLKNETVHTLYAKGEAEPTVLWTMTDVWVGDFGVANPKGAFNYLPVSATAVEPALFAMRNVAGATIQSRFFEDGIGTLYFDAVNGSAADTLARLVVEVATPPASEEDDPVWEAIQPTVLVKRAGESEFSVDETQVGETIRLAIPTGGSTDAFYRILAPINREGPVAVRIRRPKASSTALAANQILIDNVIVSKPAVGASLTPPGSYDPSESGPYALGQACAFTVPFPAKSEKELKGRVKLDFTGAAANDASIGDYLESVKLRWRWRYLNQQLEPSEERDGRAWNVSDFDLESATDEGVLTTKEILPLNGNSGDIEWYYDAVLKAPAYRYVDYSGSGVTKPTAALLEDVRVVTAHATVAVGDRFASGGKDWFLRLREGKSDWHRMQVELRAPVEGEAGYDPDADQGTLPGLYDMEMVGENLWRVFIPVPTNATGCCSFRFRGLHRQTGSPTKIELGDNAAFGPVEEGTTERMGALIENSENRGLYRIDHVTGYLEVKMSDKYLTYQMARAEYQNFNYWNDAHTFGEQFKIDPVDTNSVNVTEMKVAVADMKKWPLFQVTTNAWESFILGDYAAQGRFTKEVFHQTHETPNADWTAHNITFVSENFAAKDRQSTLSGLAGKLRGSSEGYMEYVNSKTPLGIEKVDLKARLGQSMTFDAISYNKSASEKDNYVFFVPLTMSHLTPDDGSQPGDMAVGASVSLIGYHSAETGCYEFRVSRPYSGKTIKVAINKWKIRDYAWVCEELQSTEFGLALWRNEFVTGSGEMRAEADRQYYGVMMSLETGYDVEGAPTNTLITCALTQTARKVDNVEPWKSFSSGEYNPADPSASSAVKWNLLVHNDTKEPHGWGGYGVISKDCPAKMVLPCHQDAPFANTAMRGNGYYTNKDVSLKNPDTLQYEFIHDRGDLNNKRKWATIAGRMDTFAVEEAGSVNDPWIGLQSPTNLTQRLDLFLRPNGSSDETKWVKTGTITVSGYNFTSHSFDARVKGKQDIRLRTGEGNPFDVVVDDIKPYKWQGDDMSSSSEDDFYYTQAYVETNEVLRTKFTRLQPARALASRPLAIRTPVLRGLGKFTFTYDKDTLDPNAEVWVQCATNNVRDYLSFYDESVDSIDLSAGTEAEGQWITIAKLKYSGSDDPELDLVGQTTKTIYLGWHDRADRPVEGLFRLFVPTEVVREAEELRSSDYGSITVTGVSCTDEPGASDRSWRAWNMRTIGDGADSERRMLLADMKIDDGSVGLVAALNNCTRNVVDRNGDDVDPTDKRLVSEYPTIFSPTLHPEKANDGVGQVSLKARLYVRPGEVEPNKGRITVYGSRNSAGDDWTKLTTMDVTSTVFSNYVWNAAGAGTYRAVKFVIDDLSARTPEAGLARVIIDELVISEKETPTIGVVYARPFRNDLLKATPVEDILSPREQPLSGESWGVQTQLAIRQLTDQVDPEKGFEVYLSYFRGKTPWGYEQWKSSAAAVTGVPLTLVDKDNLIFRSVGTTPASLVPPSGASSEVVQFMLSIKYYLKNEEGGEPIADWVTMDVDWQQPDWFYPVDFNAEYSETPDPRDPEHFAAYTILDTVSPGRAWINEVNWNDGTRGENGSTEDVVTNQFIELCIPSGIDLSGWKIRLTDIEQESTVFAKLGDISRGIPGRKVSKNAVNGYEFFVLQSPETARAGGIKVTGTDEPAADATWYEEALGGDVEGGTLKFSSPYQFELVRPSGVVEHQFVLDGTNTMRRFGDWSIAYDGTNLVHELDLADGSPIRFYAGEDLARKLDEAVFASVGVKEGRDDPDTSWWPGGSNTWHSSMGFTPGRINEGQTVPENWFIAPNGTNTWVYFEIATPHLSQRIGTETDPYTLILVPQGTTTNVNYTVDGWHQAEVRVDGQTVASEKTGSFDVTIDPQGEEMHVVASAAPDPKLADYGITSENPYASAVVSWLLDRYPTATTDDLHLAKYAGLRGTEPLGEMSLTDMYWLDIPPTEEGWWLRAGISDGPKDHIVMRRDPGAETFSAYTNKQIAVTLYASNAVSKVAWAPTRLQGLGYERSDEYAGAWTSVTFKVTGMIKLAPSKEFLPLRLFTFDDESFSSAEAERPFTAVIDILDPFKSPIGVNYGWDEYPNTSANFTFTIDGKEFPYTVEKLKVDSTYKSQGE